DGHKWTPQGQALDRGPEDAWESYGVITPYVAVIRGKYYLFYTGSPTEMQGPVRPKIRHLGLAVADSPDGPWKRLDNPVLNPGSQDRDEWDSTIVDDAHLILRGGECWLYYKGGGRGVTAQTTKWGLAVADEPTGPFVKHENNPILDSGHTVCVWPHRRGVAALVDNAGEERFTVQWSPDGIRFQRTAKIDFVHTGCGPYDPDAHADATYGRGITWGIAQERRQGRL
ncbi:MAG: family 43 glycosylhydrolase, partial [bacterium]|nr:family 43 glycosylhydrolase [bacterium]